MGRMGEDVNLHQSQAAMVSVILLGSTLSMRQKPPCHSSKKHQNTLAITILYISLSVTIMVTLK